MAMPTPFSTIQTALKTKMQAQGLTVYEYHPVGSLPKVPAVYLQATDVAADYMRADQGEVRIGEISYKARFYVRLDKDARLSHEDAYLGVKRMMAALRDASLGGAVRDARLERISIDPVQMESDQRPMLLVEADLTIRPAQYT